MGEPTDVVTISAERLKELEALAAKAKTVEKYYNSNKSRVLDHYHKNRDAINEKRRAAYKAKKEAEAAAKAAEAAQP
jgi:hypothetical protein